MLITIAVYTLLLMPFGSLLFDQYKSKIKSGKGMESPQLMEAYFFLKRVQSGKRLPKEQLYETR